MARAGSSFFTVTDEPPAPRAGLETLPTTIWLKGEHDIANRRSSAPHIGARYRPQRR